MPTWDGIQLLGRRAPPVPCRMRQSIRPHANRRGALSVWTGERGDAGLIWGIASRLPQEATSLEQERRAFPRTQVRKDGKILFVDQPFFIECAIRNMSENGALLCMLVTFPLPREILLWDEKTGTIYECDVRWRKEHMVGVQFVDVCRQTMRRALLEKCFGPLACDPPGPRVIH